MKNLIIAKLNEIKNDEFKCVMERIEAIHKRISKISHTNLKLHHIAYKLYDYVSSGMITDNESQNLFQLICEMEYENFQEWEAENVPSIERVYIGHTSSFYYSAKNWCGNIIDSCSLNDGLLEGEELSNNDYLGDLNYKIYNFLFDEDMTIIQYLLNACLDEEEAIEELEEYFDEQLEVFDLLNDDLDDLENILEEVEKAYGYLTEYKTPDNEVAILEQFLEHEIGEHYTKDKAEQIMNELFNEMKPLNKVTKLSFEIVEQGNTYQVLFVSNLNSTVIDIGIIVNSEMSNHYIETLKYELQQKIDENFEF